MVYLQIDGGQTGSLKHAVFFSRHFYRQSKQCVHKGPQTQGGQTLKNS